MGLVCPVLGSSEVADSVDAGAKFDNLAATAIIGPESISSFRSQPLTETSEVAEEPIKPDRTR